MNIKVILLMCVGIMIISNTSSEAQGTKYKARLSVEYHNTMESDGFIEVNAKFRGDDGFEPAKGLLLNLYQQLDEDSLLLMTNMNTNDYGVAQFKLKKHPTGDLDSLEVHKYVVKIEDNDRFSNATKSVSFKDSFLEAKIIEIDSVFHVTAQLMDNNGEPIENEKLKVMVHRLFAPLTIGESFYRTDETGSIDVPFEDPLPGIDGILTFEVIMESDDYGIVNSVFDAPIGKVVVDLSSFDQRTIWSPPSKTPIFLWIFANVLILGAWLVIFILVRNLFRIYKSA